MFPFSKARIDALAANAMTRYDALRAALRKKYEPIMLQHILNYMRDAPDIDVELTKITNTFTELRDLRVFLWCCEPDVYIYNDDGDKITIRDILEDSSVLDQLAAYFGESHFTCSVEMDGVYMNLYLNFFPNGNAANYREAPTTTCCKCKSTRIVNAQSLCADCVSNISLPLPISEEKEGCNWCTNASCECDNTILAESCYGCTYSQPNQFAHMMLGGCLYQE